MKEIIPPVEREKTLGERRVKIDFNITENDTVYKIKKKTAELIDLIESTRHPLASSERHRLIALAQTSLEEAAMWAVKAVFS